MTETAAVNQEQDGTRGARLTEITSARRLAIIVARRVLARGGVAALTLDGVAHEAGLPVGALAHHFDNEQDLLMAVAADDLADLAKYMRAVAQSSSSASTVPHELVLKVQVLERAFAGMVDRPKESRPPKNDMAAWVEQCVQDLQHRVDSPAQNLVLNEIKASLPPAGAPRTDDLRPLPASVAHLLAEAPAIPDHFPVLDRLPAPDRSPTPDRLPKPDRLPVEAVSAPLPPVLDPPTKEIPSDTKEAAVMDNYLLDARRAAIATQAGNDHQRRQSQRRSKQARIVVVALLGPLAILAGAAFMLNRNTVTAMTTAEVTPPAEVTAPATPQVAQVAPAPEVAKAPLAPPPQVEVAVPADPTPAQVATEPLDKLAALAKSGDPKAERDLGLKYLAGDGVDANETEAARWLMRAAYRGEPTAEYWLGTLYARGHGVPEDAFQANHWYEAAAKKGNRRAMHSYAVAYFQGWGVEKNYAEAARWFRSAADLGFVDSQFNLAVLYERGAGLQQSLTEAYKWYAIAAKGGDKEAEARVTALATQLPPADLALAQQAVASFKPSPMDRNANLAAEPSRTDG